MIQKKNLISKPFNIVHPLNYPELVVGVGVFEKKEDAVKNDPKKWIFENTSEIENLRKKQFFAFKTYSKKITSQKQKEIELIQNIVKAKNETDLEIDFKKEKINLKEKVSGISNQAIALEKIKIVDNIKITKDVDKITSDKQLKAKDAILEFFNKTNDVYKLEQLFSMGLLGLEKDRILVPTKWSITAIDDTIGKEIYEEIKNYKKIDCIKMFEHEFYDNKFYVIFFPEQWGFEMIEVVDNEIVSHDFENRYPKKEYAYKVCGAYYATRAICLEYLKKNEVCAKIIVIRDINKNYSSKGVWVVREGIRQALKNEKVFENKEKLLEFIEKKLMFEWFLKKSELFREIYFQKKIFEF